MSQTETDPVLRELDHLRDAMEKRDAQLDARLDAMQTQSSREHAEMAKRVGAVEDKVDGIEDREESTAARLADRRKLCREVRTTVYGGTAAVGVVVGALSAFGVL